ncbi:MAG: beta-ketoacyl synthase N-terminal-like domain-containing protein [Saprospiraceae bacterium]
MNKRIGIISYGSLSALGGEPAAIWSNYLHHRSLLCFDQALSAWVGALPAVEEHRLCASDTIKTYQKLDRTVRLALLAAEGAMKEMAHPSSFRWGINWGSSRGATERFEKYHSDFLTGEALSPNSSPLTTLGNVSSWVAQYLGLQSININHSVTCSTALHALLNGIVWLESGRCDFFLAGGTEAPLTPFTVAQMKALRIYAHSAEAVYPNQSLDLNKEHNSMVLGEGAAGFVLSKKTSHPPLAWIAGVGYAMERISSPSGISAKGMAMQAAMRMALHEAALSTVDVIVCHTPGTVQGDKAEWEAIQAVFGDNIPSLTTNKWKIGHTLGASGALSLEMALLMLQHQTFIGMPLGSFKDQKAPKKIRTIMVNATGFGGNAVSIILSKEP